MTNSFCGEERLHRFEILGGRAFVIGGELVFGLVMLDMDALGAMVDELRRDRSREVPCAPFPAGGRLLLGWHDSERVNIPRYGLTRTCRDK